MGWALLSRHRSALMAIAMLWVMLFHAYNFRFYNGPLDWFKAMGFSGVDAFVLLSGLGLYVSQSQKETPLRSYYRRRFLRVLPAFWLVVGTYSLLLALAGRLPWSTAFWNISTLYYWFGVEGAFNWYVPALLGYYLLSPFWIRALKESRRPAALTALAFAAAYGLQKLSVPLGVGYLAAFFYRIPAFCLGCLAGRYFLEERPVTKGDCAGLGIMAAFGCLLIALRSAEVFYTSTPFIFAFLVLPLCLTAAAVLERLPWAFPEKLLSLLGENSLEIYLLNVIVTREFELLCPLFPQTPRNALYYLVIYLANLLLGMGLHRLLAAGAVLNRDRRTS